MAEKKALSTADLGFGDSIGAMSAQAAGADRAEMAAGATGPVRALEPAAPSPFATDWKLAGAAVVAAVAAILFWYRDTAASIVAIWIRSETFNHCFLVLPISLYLIWRQRSALAALSPRPSFGVLALVAGAGGLWLVGTSANVLGATQWALLLMIQLSVWSLLGTQVTKAMAFPLAFLFFAIPFGEVLVPYMIDWTADMTVWALRLSGIPVFREGDNFTIPSGHWSVVEACSGLRYLIASFMVGTLYAYLTYRSATRRLVFVAASVAVPIVANWVRAYLIVLLGHVSGNRIAVGVDHLVYGWVFFGVVIALLFWIGTRWREDTEPHADIPPARANAGRAVGGERRGRIALVMALGAVLVVAGVWKPVGAYLDSRVSTSTPQLEPFRGAPGWSFREGQLTDWRPGFQGAGAELSRVFSRDGKEVGVYVSYYRNQSLNSKLISSANRLTVPRSLWISTAEGQARIDLDGDPISIRFDELRGPDGRLLVWRWYWIDGHWTASDYLGSAYLALARLLGRGDDAAVIFVHTPAGDDRNAAEQVLQEFVAAHGAALSRMLEEARAQ